MCLPIFAAALVGDRTTIITFAIVAILNVPLHAALVRCSFLVLAIFHVTLLATVAYASLMWSYDTAYPISVWGSVALTGHDNCIYVFTGSNDTAYTSTSEANRFNVTAGSPRGKRKLNGSITCSPLWFVVVVVVIIVINDRYLTLFVIHSMDCACTSAGWSPRCCWMCGK